MLSSGDVNYCVDLNAYNREVRDQLHTYSLPLSDSDAGSVAFCLHFDTLLKCSTVYQIQDSEVRALTEMQCEMDRKP